MNTMTKNKLTKRVIATMLCLAVMVGVVPLQNVNAATKSKAITVKFKVTAQLKDTSAWIDGGSKVYVQPTLRISESNNMKNPIGSDTLEKKKAQNATAKNLFTLAKIETKNNTAKLVKGKTYYAQITWKVWQNKKVVTKKSNVVKFKAGGLTKDHLKFKTVDIGEF